LRDELAAVIAERNRSQELLTVQLQELNELRAAMQSAQQENTAERHHSEEVLLQLQQERDDALQRQLEIQQQLDQLRAEAEVTRGLVDMQTPAEGDAGLRDQLEQAKKNVDVAVRLRTQVEQKNGELKAEIAALRAQLEGAALPLAGHIPSLDEGDPHAGAVLNPAYPDALGDEPRATTVLIDEEQSRRGMLSTAPASYSEASAAASAGGGLRTLIGGVVMVALAAGAGVWWVLKQPSPRPDYQQASTGPGMQDAKPQPAAENKAVPQDTVQQPAWVPSLAKGSTPNSTKVQAGVPSTDANVGADLPTADGVSVAPPRLPKRQPIRSFSEPLSSGGRAPTVVEFQADSFDMGSGISSPNFDERPRHRVDLQRFAISKHEVTFDEYDRFARDTGRSLPRDNGWGRGERPVINVRWQDALAYTQWLSEQTGSRYRLPTEAEWEFAARAGSDARFWWGNDVGDSHANCFDCGGDWAGVKTAPVGSFATSPFAVNDMAGNVMEWVQDCFQPDYTGAPDDGSAVASGDCRRRVVRGGAYDSPSESLRSASRDAREADTRLDNLGFRVVKQ
jgi:formylglycine-generating enzyme required for sulfatase activity